MDSLPPNRTKKYFESESGKEFLIFSYKLAFDALVLSLITFGGVLLSEAVAPGLVSSRLPFTAITVIIFFALMLVNFLKTKAHINAPAIELGKNNLSVKIIVFILAGFLIASSLFKFAWWQIILITGIILVILYLLYRLFFEEK